MADLTDLQASQSVKISGASATGVESNFAKVSPNQDMGTSDIVDTAGVYGSLSIGTTPVLVKVGASALSNRKLVTLDNTSTTLSPILYWGWDSSVSSTSYAGRIFRDQQASWAAGPNVTIYIVAGIAGNAAHISEAA